MKILNIGSLNIDCVYRLPHIVHPGETISASSLTKHAGGKGLNQSIALARAGAEVIHAGAIGTDGLFLKTMLEQEGVDCSSVSVLEDVPTGSAFIQVADDGENSIVLLGGANQKVTADTVQPVLKKMIPGEMVLLQNEISCLEKIFFLASEAHLRIFFNPSPMRKELADLPLELADTLLVNKEEGELLTEMIPGKIRHCNILTTLGAKGAEYSGRDGQHFFVPAVKAERVVDTTGAGDTFTGYFTAAISAGESIADAMRFGAAAASISVSKPGAAESIPHAATVKGLLSQFQKSCRML